MFSFFILPITFSINGSVSHLNETPEWYWFFFLTCFMRWSELGVDFTSSHHPMFLLLSSFLTSFIFHYLCQGGCVCTSACLFVCHQDYRKKKKQLLAHCSWNLVEGGSVGRGRTQMLECMDLNHTADRQIICHFHQHCVIWPWRNKCHTSWFFCVDTIFKIQWLTRQVILECLWHSDGCIYSCIQS